MAGIGHHRHIYFFRIMIMIMIMMKVMTTTTSGPVPSAPVDNVVLSFTRQITRNQIVTPQ